MMLKFDTAYRPQEIIYLILACFLGMSVFLIVLFVLSGDYRRKFEVLKQPYVWPFMVIIAATLVSTLYGSVSWADKLEWFDKSRKLFTVWIIAYLCLTLPSSRRYLLWALLLGIGMNLLVMYINYFLFSPLAYAQFSSAYYPLAQTPLLISFVLVVPAFLALHLLLTTPRLPLKYAALAISVLLLSSELFINFNRTGYLMVFVSGLLFALVYFRWRGVAVMGVLTVLVFSLLYHGHASFADRIDATFSNISTYRDGAQTETSVGFRLGFYRSAVALFIAQPDKLLFGFGTGAQAAVSRDFIASLPEEQRKFYQVIVNPHNQFIFYLLQSGVLLLGFFVWFLVRLFRLALHLEPAQKITLLVLNSCLVIASLFNTCLLDMGTGFALAYSIALVMAWRQDGLNPHT